MNCGPGGSLLQDLQEPVPTPGAEHSPGSYRAVQADKYMGFFWKGKKKISKKIIVVECLVELQ